MHAVERDADQMTDAELLAEAQYAQTELLAIFNEELVPIDAPGTDASTTTTSTTSDTGSSTSSTSTSTTTTSTTRAPATTTTEAAA
jgi:hypothetical protein